MSIGTSVDFDGLHMRQCLACLRVALQNNMDMQLRQEQIASKASRGTSKCTAELAQVDMTDFKLPARKAQ